MVSSFDKRLSRAINDIPMPLAEATISMLELAKQPENNPRLIFLTRAIKAIREMAQHSYVNNAVYASSDLELFLEVLEEPETLAILRKDDPLVAAKLRGIRAKSSFLEAEGGCVSDDQAADILGLSRQSIAKARQKWQIFALPRGQIGYAYPIWQFKNGRLLPGVKDVLAALKNHDSWMQVSFMLSPNTRLNKKRPLDVLRKGDIDKVVVAASALGEHGAA